MQISEIKQQLSITKILNYYGIKPDRNKRINCPFHADKTPSMQVYENTNTVYCFSSNCKTHGKAIDQIDFIKYKEFGSLSEAEAKHKAILKAAELLGEMPQIKKEVKPTTSSETPTALALSEAEGDLEILSKIFNYFRNGFIMRKDNKARNYLESRNLDIVKLQNLGIVFGYNSAQFHHRGKLNPEEMQACQAAGLLIKSSQQSRFGDGYSPWAAHCVIFPLTNEKGVITGLYGRSTSSSENPKAGKPASPAGRHFYLKNSKGLFYRPKQDTKKLIITESIIDFLSIYQVDEIRKDYDFLPIYGTNRLTEEHLSAVASAKALTEIIFFFDGDKAAEKYSKQLHKDYPGLRISKVETPENEDINSLLQGHEAEILSHLLDKRLVLSEAEVTELFLSIETEASMNPIENKKEENQNKKPLKPNNQPNLENKLPFKAENQPNKEKEQITASQLPPESSLNTKNPELLLYKTKDLKITVLGGIRISGLDRLKVTLKIERRVAADNKNQVHSPTIRHSLDLYHAKQTEQLTEMISNQTESSSSKTRKIIANLTTELENYRQRRLESLKPKVKETYRMSEAEKIEAINYLKNPKLMQQTLKDIETSGVIGEQSNAMTGFIVNLSRKREKPLHVMYLGASGSGKTHLQESLSALIPEEDRIEATGLSDQSLYYEGLKLKGKILFIEDLDGAENVIYIIRELQSKGKISKRVAWRDNKGNTKTIEIIAEGPVVISSCTTKEKLYEDNANRCILLYIDQSKEQDKKIMDYMKVLSTGKIKSEDQQQIKHKMQNVQRMLRPVKVYNPYAHLIDLPPEVFKPRRSLPLLLGFIETLTFYHQYQRKRITADNNGNPTEPYILSTIEDVEQSFNLMKEVLFSKSDELSKASRDFLERLKKEVKPGETFYTKEIRKKFRISASALQRYMSELKSYGYLKLKAGNRYRGYEYIITDYNEYKSLRQSIERRFEAILQNIRKISNPVAQSSPPHKVGYLNVNESIN